MDPNQLVTLLRIFKNSFNGKKRYNSDKASLVYLSRRGLIEMPDDDGAWYVTVKGHELANSILEFAGEKPTTVKLDPCKCACHETPDKIMHGPHSTCCGTCHTCSAKNQTRAHMIECQRVNKGDHK